MKTTLISGLLLAASLAASAQEIQTKGAHMEQLKATTKTRPAQPNQIVTKTVTYDGVAVQSVKTDNPVQLVNPLAPAQYGNGEQNVSRDPETKKVRGLAIFRMSF